MGSLKKSPAPHGCRFLCLIYDDLLVLAPFVTHTAEPSHLLPETRVREQDPPSSDINSHVAISCASVSRFKKEVSLTEWENFHVRRRKNFPFYHPCLHKFTFTGLIYYL